MTYNEKYRVKRLSPHDRRQPDIEDDLDENEDDEDWLDYAGPLGAVTRCYDYELSVVPPRRTARVDHYHDDPYFTHAPVTHAPPVQPHKKLKVHWLVYVGAALILFIVLHYATNDIGAWWQQHTDDTTYGMPRTYQVDAVVGHNDSNSNPSHFEAENIRGHIIVIELPGGDASKSRVFGITSEMDGNASVPVTVHFQDINGDGKLDMVVVVGDPGNTTTFTLFNDGTQFVAKL